MTKGTDYKVVNSTKDSQTNVGNYSTTIAGTGNTYYGVKTFTWTINKANASAEYSFVNDFTSETETDNIASLWQLTVTPGTDPITSVGVKVKDNESKFHGSDEIFETPAISEGTVVFGVVVNHAAVDVAGITAVVNGSDIEAMEEPGEWE